MNTEAANMNIHHSGYLFAKYVPAYVMTIPTTLLKVTIIPFDIASLTGWVNSTLKLKAIGNIGRVKNPLREPLIQSRTKLLFGRVIVIESRLKRVPMRITFSMSKYFFVLSNNFAARNEPTKPQKMKQTPMILVCFVE